MTKFESYAIIRVPDVPSNYSSSSNPKMDKPSLSAQRDNTYARLKIMGSVPKVKVEKTANTSLMNTEENKITYEIFINNNGEISPN
jgi:hypothetical protein